ncbi:olfactory receptor 1E16-like [Ambystoma mexicanum]|uniref:olfactory receptor 1E16-like n=1 Tax=Ambystoma mexicanum TaxID=8296 RepID=UPI0037E813BD
MAATGCSKNATHVEEFLLAGLHILPELKLFFCVIFLMIYVLTLAGNSLIVVTVSASDHLRSPMFFLLSNFSFLEIWYATSTAPSMLSGILADGSSISFAGCLMQFYFFTCFATIECFLLTVMAYDRYTAICFPLHYTTLMDRRQCLKLISIAWVGGLTNNLLTLILLCKSKFSGEKMINHFFCEFAPLIKAACSDTSFIEFYAFFCSFVILIAPFILIIMSYAYIMSAILKIPSANGRHKAFSTCSSHLAVVSSYFGPLIAVYATPRTEGSRNLSNALSLLYSAITPLLNPVIYTLRNKEIREAWRKAFQKTP